jgi:hypothetical protein
MFAGAVGLNVKSSERITLQKVASCAPIITKPYAEVTNLSFGAASNMDQYIPYNMGPVIEVADYTYSFDTHYQRWL